MDMKQAAWQHRPDVVELDWNEICNQQDYKHANILNPRANTSKRPPLPLLERVCLASIVLAVLALIVL